MDNRHGALANVDILVTGHTGFTGTWVSHWLAKLGARVHGLALEPNTTPNIFNAAGTALVLASHTIGDINDFATVLACIEQHQPKLILHLAAQPLVLKSYSDPVGTFMTNVQGTVHVLEAARLNAQVEGVLCVTTDKVYENQNWIFPYRELDRLGGSDPYSASKASAELVIASYRASLPSWQRKLIIDCARGGNIIGGGDWSDNRLIPDFVRATVCRQPLEIRNPAATRPWQHVLCLIDGYLTLLERMILADPANGEAGEAWNFGPDIEDCVPVKSVLDRLTKLWTPAEIVYGQVAQHEAQLLVLDSTKARQMLHWRPRWGLSQTLLATAEWYQRFYQEPAAAAAVTIEQIDRYCCA